MSPFWQGKRAVITGGAGFIGSPVRDILLGLGAEVFVADIKSSPGTDYFDRHNIHGNLDKYYTAYRAIAGKDVVIHMAAAVAGVGYNAKRSFEMFRANEIPAANVLWACGRAKIKRVLYVSSACVYDDAYPMAEENGWLGEPAKANAGYGWAKRTGERMALWLSRESPCSVSIVRPFNAYGPGDNFEPDKAHVIPSLIRKAHEGGNTLRVWGSPETRRSFVFVRDLAEGIVAAAEKLPPGETINLGRDEEVSMQDLALLICRLCGKPEQVAFDVQMPVGSTKRRPEIGKARFAIGWSAGTTLTDGLKETIEWYRKSVSPVPA